jgi:hypothetical protein
MSKHGRLACLFVPLKPEITLTGAYGSGLRDEIELEKRPLNASTCGR